MITGSFCRQGNKNPRFCHIAWAYTVQLESQVIQIVYSCICSLYILQLEPCFDGNLGFSNIRTAALLLLAISAPVSFERKSSSIPLQFFSYAVTLLDRIFNSLVSYFAIPFFLLWNLEYASITHSFINLKYSLHIFMPKKKTVWSYVKPSKPIKHSKQEKGSPPKKAARRPAKENSVFIAITQTKAKMWAAEDLVRTISWLERQEEKPDPSDIKKIAAEGILTCIQDAIDALRAGQGIQQVTEQWAFVPRVVEELASFDQRTNNSDSTRRDALCREAMGCKQIYELEFLNAEHDDDEPRTKNKSNEASCDSDSTVEMTEEEIDLAYNSIMASCK